MGIVRGIRHIDRKKITPNGKLTLTLGLMATPGIYFAPAQILLVLDHSQEVSGEALDAVKQGAAQFAHLVSMACGGKGEAFRRGSRMGLVGFGSSARLDVSFAGDVGKIQAALADYAPEGSASTAEALALAKDSFDEKAKRRKILVLFTHSPKSLDPALLTLQANQAGIELYFVGLSGDGLFMEWENFLAPGHLVLAQEPCQLAQAFVGAGKKIVDIGARDVVLRQELDPEFSILKISSPKKGTAQILDAHTVLWKMEEIGTPSTDIVSLKVIMQHTSTMEGVKAVNKNITYEDHEGSEPIFSEDSVTVESSPETKCPQPVCPDPCPPASTFELTGCQDSKVVELPVTHLDGLGRMVQLNTTLKNVCPSKRVALAVQLTEVTATGSEYSRGLKTFTIPAQGGRFCRDLRIECIRFILPEDLDVSGGCPSCLCNTRKFNVRVMAHYIDSDFECCCDEQNP